MSFYPGSGSPGGMPPPPYAAPPYAAPPYQAPPGYFGSPCPQCGAPSAGTRTCGNCRQVFGLPVGVRLASPGRRLGAYALSILLAIVTLGIGWLIWDLVLLSKGSGQSPGKQLLRTRVVSLDTGGPAGGGKMLLRGLVKVVAAHLVYGVLALYLLIDKDNQELWDKAASTVVIDDPQNMYAPDNLQAAPAYGQQYQPQSGMPYEDPHGQPAPYQSGSYQPDPSQPYPGTAPGDMAPPQG